MTVSNIPDPASGGWGKAIPWVIGIGAFVGLIYLIGSFKRKIISAIADWTPAKDAKESEHRNDLATILRSLLPDSHILEEHGTARSRVDISIKECEKKSIGSGDKIAIELKVGLKGNNELNRLVGQLVSYRQEGYNSAFVIAIDAEPNFQQLLNDRGQADGLSGFVTIINKETS